MSHKQSPKRGFRISSITHVSFDFLKQQHEYVVHEFLDDPDGMSGNIVAEIVAIYQQLCQVGADINEPFWKVAKKEGTDCEVWRLVRYLQQGGVTDIPKNVLALAKKYEVDNPSASMERGY